MKLLSNYMDLRRWLALVKGGSEVYGLLWDFVGGIGRLTTAGGGSGVSFGGAFSPRFHPANTHATPSPKPCANPQARSQTATTILTTPNNRLSVVRNRQQSPSPSKPLSSPSSYTFCLRNNFLPPPQPTATTAINTTTTHPTHSTRPRDLPPATQSTSPLTALLHALLPLSIIRVVATSQGGSLLFAAAAEVTTQTGTLHALAKTQIWLSLRLNAWSSVTVPLERLVY
ncbi:hypothetical protein V490_03356 [Pseudogymnoascus sp. VKM F-3557]|nr:hypothetical protein V490_03356 [Pseudogymnoascus sp. VKM F-3557]